MQMSFVRSRRLIVLFLSFCFTLLHAVSFQSPRAHASVTPVHKARLSSPSLLLVSTISGDTHVLRARDGSEMWTLRGARVSVSTFQRENFFGYKLAPALDGNLFRVDGDRGLVERLPRSVQELVNLAPFVLDDGSIVTGTKSSESMVMNSVTGAVMNVFASAGSGSGSSNDPKVSRNLHAPSASGSGVPIILNFERYTVRSVDSASGLEQWNVSITKLSSAALNPPAAPHLQDADGEFIDSLFFSTSGNALQAISKANRSVVWSQVLSAGATAVWYVPDGASAQEKLLVPLVSSAFLEGSDHGNVNDAESLRDAVLMSTKEGGGQIVVLDSHEGALLVRNEPSFFHHLRHDPNAIGRTQNYASIESPGKNGNAIVVSSSASQSSSSGLSNIENSFSRIQSCVLGKDCQRAVLHVVNPQIEESKASTSSLSKPGVVYSTSSGSSNVTHFELVDMNSPVLVLALSAFIVVLILVIFFVASSRFRLQNQRERVVIEDEGHDLVQEPPKSPIQTGAPLNSHPLPPNQESDAENSDGADSDRVNEMDSLSATRENSVKTPAQTRRERRKRLALLKSKAILPTTAPSLPPPSSIGKLEIFFKSVLGQGSHGTIVYKGRLENRDVAVKRLLREFTEVADKEIDLLIRSDEHSSVVRYFAKEFDGNFVYLALELCDCNLRQLVENDMWASYNIPTTGHPARPILQGDAGSQVKRALQQLVDGVVYLHRLGIVHRDLKPLNVLVSSRMRLKISDMGLARKLEQDQSSFETVAGGSFGWRAAEQILGKKCNKSVDVFTIGCLLYYVLTGGGHPFGRETHKREANIMEHDADLSELQGPEAAEAQVLIASMISAQPERRISALQVYRHPFFWGPRLRLQFVRSLSDYLERLYEHSFSSTSSSRSFSPSNPLVVAFEALSCRVFRNTWDTQIDPTLMANLGGHRKYNTSLLRDLMRVIRNKWSHYHDLAPDVQSLLGPLPAGFVSYFQHRFPMLVVVLHDFVQTQGIASDPEFVVFFADFGSGGEA